MVSTLNEARAISTSVAVEQTEVSTDVAEGLRLARFCALEESVGLVFGVMTVTYIVLSQGGLAP